MGMNNHVTPSDVLNSVAICGAEVNVLAYIKASYHVTKIKEGQA